MEFDGNDKLAKLPEDQGMEIAPTGLLATARAEIEGALVLAKRFPRKDEITIIAEAVKVFERPGMAEEAEYVFPRGGKDITGPSVYLARELTRLWGNVRCGITVVREEKDERTIEGFAWDVQTNYRVTAQDTFKKMHFRKEKVNFKTGEVISQAGWYEPDERDLRELHNRRASILLRNCLLGILPSDLVEEALKSAKKTKGDKASKDPQGELKKVLYAFNTLNVNPTALAEYLGHALETISPAEIVQLRGVYKSISEGNSTWNEYVSQAAEAKKPELKKAAKPQPATAAQQQSAPAAAPETPRESGFVDEWAEEQAAVTAPIEAELVDGPVFDPASRPAQDPTDVYVPPAAPAAAPVAQPKPTPAPKAKPLPAQAPVAKAPAESNSKITRDDWSKLYLSATGTYHWTKDSLKAMLGSFGFTKPEDITTAALGRIMAIIEQGPPKGA